MIPGLASGWGEFDLAMTLAPVGAIGTTDWGTPLSRRSLSWHVLCFPICLLPWIWGCGGSRPPQTRLESLPLSSLSRAELTARINQDAASITTLKGKLQLGMRVPPAEGFKRCRGVIASRSLWNGQSTPGLFLEGYRQLIPTLFTLVSDGREFWLHVPYDNTAYNGPLGGPHAVRHGREIQLDVLDLFRALFVEPMDSRDSVEVAEEGSDYVVSVFHDGGLQRRLWIERRGFTVPREMYYGPKSDVRLQIDREAYADAGGRAYPMRIVLRDVSTGGTVLLEFGSLTLQPEKVDERIFHPKLPPGTVIRRTDLREATR